MTRSRTEVIHLINWSGGEHGAASVLEILKGFGPQYQIIPAEYPRDLSRLPPNLVLVVISLGSEVGNVRRWLMTDRYQLQLEMMRSFSPEYAALHRLGVLGLLVRHAREGEFRVVLLADAPEEEIKPDQLQNLAVPPRFSLIDPRSLDRGFFDLLDGKVRYGFPEERELRISPWLDPSKNWGPFSRLHRDKEYDRRINQEFDRPTVVATTCKIIQEGHHSRHPQRSCSRPSFVPH